MPRSAAVEETPLLSTIVCAVDFSASARQGARYAASLAREAKAHLVLVHVLDKLPEGEPRALLHFNMPEYRSFMEVWARQELEGILPAADRASLKPEETVVAGRSWEGVLRVAAEKKANLVVIGVRGRSSVDMVLFGSTTNHVVRGATCPVLTVLER